MIRQEAVSHPDEVVIDVEEALLFGNLVVPDDAIGIVLFAHGSGSSRFSPRNRQVADYLNQHQIGTLLFDLLTARENEVDEVTRQYRFDIALLGRRLDGAVTWLLGQPRFDGLPLGLFGASTGAAAALITAAHKPHAICAVVSRGGRPDLAEGALAEVKAPVLLIVGGFDEQVIALNEQAASGLHCEYRIEIIPGATHLFTEPGKLDAVCRLAVAWFERHFKAAAARGS